MFDGIKLIRRKYISISEVISLSYTIIRINQLQFILAGANVIKQYSGKLPW